MKRNHKQMWRTVIALVLTFTLVFGSVSTAFATENTNQGNNEPISYVSIGDSMTNGYGLTGYEPNGENYYGFLVETPEAYPALVKQALAEKKGCEVELTQLATSGLRADDVFYLLNYGTDNAVEWDEYGRTYVDAKFEDRVRQLEGTPSGMSFSRIAGGYLPDDNAHAFIIENAAKIYQEAVKDADVISVAVGSNNFATLLHLRISNWLARITGNTDMFGGYGGDFKFDELVTDMDPEIKTEIEAIYDKVEKMMFEAAAESDIDMDAVIGADGSTMRDLATDMANTLAYTTAGFALGYKGTIETIQKVNPDAEIIIVGLTNWFKDVVFTMPFGDTTFEIPMGDMIDEAYKFAGTYMAALPTVYGEVAYANGETPQKMYYADPNAEGVADIELIIDQIKAAAPVDFEALYAIEQPEVMPEPGDDGAVAPENYTERYKAALEIAEGITSDAIPEGTTRLRTLQIIGPMVIGSMGMLIPDLSDVENFDKYVAGEFEFDKNLNVSFTIPGFGEVWSTTVSDFDAYIFNKYGKPENDVCTINVLDYLNDDQDNALLAGDFSLVDTAIGAAFTYYYGGCIAYSGIEKSLIASTNLPTVNGADLQLLSSMQGLMDSVFGVLDGYMTSQNHLAAALIADPAMQTVSNMMFSFMVGDGVIVHPSVNGHQTLADVIMDAIENDYTVKDHAIKEILYYINEYYDDAYRLAYDYAEKEGYIEDAVEGIDKTIEVLNNEVIPAVEEDTQMTEAFKAELLKEIAEIIKTLETARALILEADELDQASLDALLALLHDAGVAMNQLAITLGQAASDVYELVIIPALEEAYDILMNEVIPQAKEQLKIAIEKGTEWLINKLEEVYAEFVEWLVSEALPGADKAMYDWLYNNPETVINFFIEYGDDMAPYIEEYGDEVVAVLMYALYTYGPEAVEWAIENPEEAIATWVKWYNKHGHKVWPMIEKYLKTMDEMGMFDDVKAAMKEAAEQLEAYVIAYAEKVVAELQAIYDELNEAAQAALAELIAAIEAVDVDAILAALEELYDAGVAIWDGATSGYYAATEDSYYVALGDTNVEYAEIVAEELDLEKDQFVNYGIEDMTAAELKDYLNAGDEDLIAEIEKADLITLGFSNNTITKAAADALAAVMSGETVEFDWAPYVGKEGAEAMDAAIEAIEAALVAEGADAATIDMVATVVEAYAFACTEFACNYPEAINAIKAINPEVQVVVVGMYNPFENAVLAVEGVEVPVGDFVGMLVDLANVHYTSYALLTGNAIYVHAPAVETKAPFEEAMDIAGFASVLTDLDSLEPSAAGHEYIAEQILDAMNVVSKAVYDAQKLIDEIKAFGEVTRDNLADAKALAEAARAAWDKLTDEEKALIGLDNYKVLVDFELAVAKVELGVAEDIAAAEKALAEAQAKAAEVERALKITESTVANLKAKVVNKSQIKVTWKAPETTPDQYRVTLLRAGKKVGTYWVAGDKETVTLKNLLRGTNFTVRVTPVAKVDGKKYFSIYKTSNKVKTQLQKANLTVKKAGAKKQIISKDQNSTGFQIYISQDKNFKKNVKKLVYQTNKKGLNVKVKAKNFKKGTNYVKVRAYTKVNGKKVYGAWSGTVKVVK